jgi:hypothetical protein
MSIGTSHVINKLEKNSKALPLQRLARIIAKKNKDGDYESEHLKESKCISVPMLQPQFTPEQINAIAPHIVGMLESAQDSIIRDLIITDGVSSIHENQISFDECVKYLDDSAKGNRVTSEYMNKWFFDTYGEPALEFICTQVCKFDPEELTADQSNVIEKRSNVLASMFAGFASGKYRPDIPKCKAIAKFGEWLGGEENWDSRMKNIQEKTAKIRKELEDALSMDALGFDS